MDNSNDRDFFETPKDSEFKATELGVSSGYSTDIDSSGIQLTSDRQIITARGTGDGLVIRIDGRVQPEQLKGAFFDFIKSRKRFLAGNHVSIEWVGQIPDAIFVSDLIGFAESQQIEVISSSLKEEKKKLFDSQEISKKISNINVSSIKSGMSLGAVGVKEDLEVVRQSPGSASSVGIFGGIDVSNWDEPDTRIIASTIRGGQKIETEHSLVIFGDVNSGAELIAGGDIIVLGTLRGVAHAGAYDETGAGKVIFSLNMQATQLRIGSVISRGSGEYNTKVPEIARVDGTQIVVEPYQAKTMLQREGINFL